MALILLAGLKTLPADILDAAKVDGATGPQRLWFIILPLLLPAAFLALILRMRTPSGYSTSSSSPPAAGLRMRPTP